MVQCGFSCMFGLNLVNRGKNEAPSVPVADLRLRPWKKSSPGKSRLKLELCTGGGPEPQLKADMVLGKELGVPHLHLHTAGRESYRAWLGLLKPESPPQ